VWHHSKPLLILATLILLGFLAVMLGADDPSTAPWEVSLYCLAGVAVWWVVAIRPRTALVTDELVVVAWLRVRRVGVAEILSGHSGYHGAQLALRNGSSIVCGTLQTPNYDRFLGRQSRSDRAVSEILAAAAAARGDEPPVPGGKHRG
jgi:hypothetical protein